MMINLPQKNISKKPKKLTIANHEISSVLDLSEPYIIAREKFELLRNYCMQTLGITREHPSLRAEYKNAMDHYLRNAAHYIMDSGDFKTSDSKEIAQYKRNYKLFLSVVYRISTLDDQQKLSFLQHMKAEHDLPPKKIMKNHIVLMDHILSTL